MVKFGQVRNYIVGIWEPADLGVCADLNLPCADVSRFLPEPLDHGKNAGAYGTHDYLVRGAVAAGAVAAGAVATGAVAGGVVQPPPARAQRGAVAAAAGWQRQSCRMEEAAGLTMHPAPTTAAHHLAGLLRCEGPAEEGLCRVLLRWGRVTG